MALTSKEIRDIRKALDESARPLFFFDDDPDGVCAFLQLYKYKGDGKGVIVKAGSEVTEDFVRKVDEYYPDLVVILDMPRVSQDFIDRVGTKIIWLDHHDPAKPRKVKYYNPRVHDDEDNRPTSYWAWKIAQKDIWIALVGCVGDWFLPDFAEEARKKYPYLLKKGIKKPEDALFGTKAGLLAKIIYLNLKGTVSDAMGSVKTLTRIDDPKEILEQTTPKGRYIYKKFEKHNREYTELINSVKKTRDPLLIFIYPDNKTSFTSELSNELLYKHPSKIIIVGREKNGEIKLSMRAKKYKIEPMLQKALEGVEGFGGGHTYACGANVKKRDFKIFIENIRSQI